MDIFGTLHRFALAVALSLVALSPVAGAASPALRGVTLTESPIGVSLTPEVQLLRDPSARLSASDIFQKWDELAFEDRPSGLSEGYLRGAVWVRLQLNRSEASPSRWWLTFSNPLIDRVVLYALNPDGTVSEQRTGEGLARSQRAAPTVLSSIPRDLRTGQTRLLIRLESRNALATRLTLRDLMGVLEQERLNAMESGLLAGGHLAVMIASLAVALSSRNRVWWLFSVFVVSNGLLLLYSLGHPSWWIFEGASELGDILNGLLLVVATLTAAEFCARLIGSPLSDPGAYRAWSKGLLIAAVLTVAGLAMGHFSEVMPIYLGAIVLTVPLMLASTLRQWRRGLHQGGYFAAGMGIYVIASELRLLRNLGFLPSAWWTEGLQELMSIGYLSILALGIGLQARTLASDRERLTGELQAERRSRAAERDFLAMLSHELRTPLATIDATTRVLREVTTLDEAGRDLRYQKIERSAGRVRALFDRHLGGTRIRDDWHLPRFESVPLNGLLSTLRDQALADRADQRINLKLPPHDVLIQADPGLISIAVDNLLDNALAYGPPDAPVELSLASRHGFWRILVRDRGLSLPQAEHNKLFDKYVRGSTGLSRPGVGLGLFVVRRIAQSHGGAAGLDLPPGGGNAFWIDLPIDPASGLTAAGPSRVEASG